MSEALAAALSEAGVETTLLSLDGPEWLQTLTGALGAGAYDHAVAFGSFSAELMLQDGRSLYDAFGCGFIGWDFDHPVYQFRRFTTPIARRLQVCASQSHFDFAASMGMRARPLLMFPGVDAVTKDPLPLDVRPIDLTVAISWLGEPERWWAEWKGTPAYRLIEGIVERMLAGEDAEFGSAFRGALQDAGLEVALDENLSNILARVGLYIRQHDRLKLAEALRRGDGRCLILGRGWADRLGARAGLTFGDDLEYSQLREVYENSRVVLNVNAANGGSERALLAMASGALVISDTSPLLRAEFGQADAIRFFDRRDPATILEAVGRGLSDDAQAVANRGYNCIQQRHLWTHKATCLLDQIAA